MTPYTPPRRFFADAAHHAAFLSYLDGVDRMRAGSACLDVHGKRQFAAHALVSLENARFYLQQSSIWKGLFSFGANVGRPEYGPQVVLGNISVCELRAADVLRCCAPLDPVGRDLPFALVVNREGASCLKS